MKHFTAIFAALITAAAPASAQIGNRPAEGIDIVVADAPQPRYAHGGRWYIEALKGREYAVRIRNPFGVRVAVALSVDGLNTIDARHSSAADARKWVLQPYETITIGGWQTSRSEARRFEFTSEEQSYGQALGQTRDLGVISAVFFRERAVPTTHSLERDAPSGRDARARGVPQPSAERQEASQEKAQGNASEDLAATGMGRRTSHEITQVRLDLETSPALSVDVRYEFRPQLVKLGILPAPRGHDPLQRRERAEGFAPGFSPVPWRFR